jgi:hypothetical protein
LASKKSKIKDAIWITKIRSCWRDFFSSKYPFLAIIKNIESLVAFGYRDIRSGIGKEK